jgi:hypothetical protein
VAVVHGLGTGSDAQAPWMIGITASCVTALLLAELARLCAGWRSRLPLRLVVGLAATASVALFGGPTRITGTLDATGPLG